MHITPLALKCSKESHLLFKVIDQKYKQDKPIIFTANVQEPDWTEILGNPLTTRAKLDRVFHHSIKVKTGQATANIKENCYRKNTINKSTKASSFPQTRITR